MLCAQVLSNIHGSVGEVGISNSGLISGDLTERRSTQRRTGPFNPRPHEPARVPSYYRT